MLAATVDAGVQGRSIGRERVVDVVVAQTALIEADDEGAGVVDRRGRRVELRRGGERGARKHERDDGERGREYTQPQGKTRWCSFLVIWPTPYGRRS
jgi:hypothetical protein